MSAVIYLLLLLLSSLIGGTRSTSIKILAGDGGSCEEETCSLQSTVSKTEEKEIKIDVKDSGTFIKIHTTVGKQDRGNHATVVFVLTTEVSVKTWRISSSGDSLNYSATLLPTNMSNSNIQLVISTRSEGEYCNCDGHQEIFLKLYFSQTKLHGSVQSAGKRGSSSETQSKTYCRYLAIGAGSVPV